MAERLQRLKSDPEQAAWDTLCHIPDPEVPVLTIEDLGVLRDVEVREDGTAVVTITPTYTGCPAMSMFAFDIEATLLRQGFEKVEVKTVLSPAWTTDWLTETAKEKLRAYGIAPPQGKASRRALFGEETVTCPRCGSTSTSRISEFGSTACKALYRCEACREPFDYFKCI